MSWFLAKLVYRIICGAGDHQPQFDEQLRLVQAAHQQQALQKAQQMGLSEQMTFRNNKEQLVQWKFVNVCEVYQLPHIADGAEIYSRIEEKEDGPMYEDIVHAKARYLLDDVNAPHLQKM